jgi:chromosome partitioning protein
MRTVAVGNQKGGCGKTTTAINTAAAFAALGYQVLLIDLDPQSHATLGLGYDPNDLDKTIYDAMTNAQTPMPSVIIQTNVERLDLAPSNILLAGAELDLRGALGKELVLSEQLRMVADRYDMCIIDCPPSLGLLMLNALVASTDVIVPVQVHFFALEGLKRLLKTIQVLRDRFYPCSVKPLGLLLTLVETRTILSRQVQRGMREFFGSLVFDTVIHRTVTLAEAPGAGETVLTYAPNSTGAAEYKALAQEARARMRTQEVANLRDVV